MSCRKVGNFDILQQSKASIYMRSELFEASTLDVIDLYRETWEQYFNTL